MAVVRRRPQTSDSKFADRQAVGSVSTRHESCFAAALPKG